MKRIQRRSPPVGHFEIACELGDKLREEFGEVRYSDYIVFVNGQWTRRATWERWDDGRWIEFDLPLLNY
jgi:hypothetical protein